MTAFDNIKTNNWPATSNDFEDFQVLKLPLNDQASLTESLPVVAGSKQIRAKRTGFTNEGVVIEASTGSNKKHYDNHAVWQASDRLSLPSQSDFIWGTRDFTWEVWVYPTTLSGTLYDTGEVNTNGHTSLFIDGSYMYWRMKPGTDCYVSHTASGYTTNQWQHIAGVRHNGVLKLYRNGVLIQSQANNSSVTQGTWAIGYLNGYAGSYAFAGMMQDYRIYNFARYIGNFTPPGAILG